MTDAAPSVEERLRRLEAENTELRKENAQKKAAAGAPKSPATEAKQRRRTPKSRRKRVTSTDFFMPVGLGAEMKDGFQRTVADLLGDQGKAFKQALVETNIQHINDYGNALSIINSDHRDEIFFAIFDKACAMGKGARSQRCLYPWARPCSGRSNLRRTPAPSVPALHGSRSGRPR